VTPAVTTDCMCSRVHDSLVCSVRLSASRESRPERLLHTLGALHRPATTPTAAAASADASLDGFRLEFGEEHRR
jgi:hypothetical protein